MSQSKHTLRENRLTVVAARMAEAVMYLSNVARDAGLLSISKDLLSIKKKLEMKIPQAAIECAKRQKESNPHRCDQAKTHS